LVSYYFCPVFLILTKFAWKPILSAVKARDEMIKGSLESAAKAREDMLKLRVITKQFFAKREKNAKIF